MKLVKKNTFNHIMQAVIDVSGYETEELLKSKQRSITSWVQLGIYVAHQSGLSIEEASSLFGRHFATGHASIKKVKGKFNEVEEDIKDIMSAKMKLELEEK
jgi:hypothetical protein